MTTPKIFESEYRFCLILWEHEPLPSAELARLCKEKLGWSRTTTYTVIHRLSERGVVKNENGIVSSLISKDDVQASELDELVEKTFEGSLPAFIAAFTRRTDLSQTEIDQLRAMIDETESTAVIEVDGGISAHNSRLLFDAGADALVAGSAVFGAPDPQAEIERMLQS